MSATPPVSPQPLQTDANAPSAAIADMLAQGLLEEVNAGNIAGFIAGDGLRVLFFAGPHNQRSDAHDVAVALREVLKDYRGRVTAGLVAADEAALQPRFRVLVLPSLVLLIQGEVLEILPRVRDWSDYVEAFQRYLGAPRSHEELSA